jgi:hypothetical protein
MPKLLGQISSENICSLETTFAVLTPAGWIIPDWLIWLKEQSNASAA